jgi:hypothetical protein
MGAVGFWTYALSNGSLQITEEFNLRNISIVLVSGTGFISGSTFANGIPATNVNLALNTPVTISTGSTNAIGNLTISTNGGINIIGF